MLQLDCIIIGGGPAGLTAATYLGRFRRRILVIDAGKSRAALIPKTRNYPGFVDGIEGVMLLKRLREQAQNYGAELFAAMATQLSSNDGMFFVGAEGRTFSAPYILLASGLEDVEPPLPELQEAVESGAVRYCPICDGYEAIDRKTAVYGALEHAIPKASFLRTYSSHVTILPTHGTSPPRFRESLAETGIVVEKPPVRFQLRGDRVAAQSQTGHWLEFDVLYPALGCKVHSGLVRDLGVKCSSTGCVVVDEKQQTSVAGIFAAGDVVSDLHQIAVGTAHACIAASAIHDGLGKNYQ